MIDHGKISENVGYNMMQHHEDEDLYLVSRHEGDVEVSTYLVHLGSETCDCCAFIEHCVCKHLVMVQSLYGHEKPFSFVPVTKLFNRGNTARAKKGRAALAKAALIRQ